MLNVIGVKFKKTPKVYFFDPLGFDVSEGCMVVVETMRGVEIGEVTMGRTEVEDDKVVSPLKPILRVATDDDIKKMQRLDAKYDETMRTCGEIIQDSGLNMKLVDVEYTFDETKLIVHFASDGRVDFRDLVKRLAGAFRIRIELRQIGARDECRMIGGLGPCGRVCCCKAYLNDYTRVSIKMAKNQSLSLNPAKISGLCGRLMCCLEYENAHYVETNRRMPKMGASIKTEDGREGNVVGINQIKETVRLKIPDKDMFTFEDFGLNQIIFTSKAKPNSQTKDDDDDDDSFGDLNQN